MTLRSIPSVGAVALLALGGVALCGSCRGEAVLDSQDSEGGGGQGAGPATSTTFTSSTSTSSTSTSSTSTSSTSTSSTSTSCDALEQSLVQTLHFARWCDMTAYQCTGNTMVKDTCGCDVAANDDYPEAAQAALSAYQAWVSAGCGPVPCSGCPPPGSIWYCDGVSGYCYAFDE